MKHLKEMLLFFLVIIGINAFSQTSDKIVFLKTNDKIESSVNENLGIKVYVSSLNEKLCIENTNADKNISILIKDAEGIILLKTELTSGVKYFELDNKQVQKDFSKVEIFINS